MLMASVWALRVDMMKEGEDILAIITNELSKQFYCHRKLSECTACKV
jgi:hypothetical protein